MILTEVEKNDILRKYYISEQTDPEKFLNFNDTGNTAGQFIFDYIRGFEEFVPFTYDDAVYPSIPFNGNKPKGTLTIGYGTTDPQYAFRGNRIDKETAKKISARDINEAADCIKRWQNRDPENRRITINMYQAMIDMVYNMGCGKFVNSEMIVAIENKNYTLASDKILKADWGNERRRQSTSELFIKDIN
jgi:GH24 family phage-related lysozyme (muramidase)